MMTWARTVQHGAIGTEATKGDLRHARLIRHGFKVERGGIVELGLTDKTVIVTGGGSNIGRAIVFAFVEEGANVVNAELDDKQGRKVTDDADARGPGRALLVKTDVTDCDSVQAMVEKTLKEFGQIDVLVNNVGWTSQDAPFLEQSPPTWERQIDLDFWSTVNCTRAVAQHMIDRRLGAIVNISSGAGRIGQPGQAVYSGIKGAIIALTKALARELGRYGIRVNVVCPGLIVPPGPDVVGEISSWTESGIRAYRTPEMQQRLARMSPLGRLGTPEDIADMVAVLASDRASFMTGQTISVDGGATMV